MPFIDIYRFKLDSYNYRLRNYGNLIIDFKGNAVINAKISNSLLEGLFFTPVICIDE
jgi:hypothetical protein